MCTWGCVQSVTIIGYDGEQSNCHVIFIWSACNFAMLDGLQWWNEDINVDKGHMIFYDIIFYLMQCHPMSKIRIWEIWAVASMCHFILSIFFQENQLRNSSITARS